MNAKFDSVCPVCRTGIKAGENVDKTNVGWAHYNCARHHDRSKALKHRLMR